MSALNALVVEDRPNIMRQTASLLRRENFDVFAAKDKLEAIRIFNKHSSQIDLVITDCRLNEDDEDDIGGMELASWLKKRRPNLLVVGISGHHQDSTTQASFDLFIQKAAGRREGLRHQLPKIRQLAMKHTDAEFEHLPEQVRFIQSKYQITDSDLTRLLSMSPLTPGFQASLANIHTGFDPSEEEQNDYEVWNQTLVSIDPNSTIGSDAGIKHPIVLLLVREDDCVIAELFGFPQVYTYGDSEKEAIDELVTILKDYFEDFTKADVDYYRSDDLLRFRRFLFFCFSE